MEILKEIVKMKDIDMTKDRYFIPVVEMIDLVVSEGGRLMTVTDEMIEYEYEKIFSRSMVSKDGLVDSFHFQVRVDRKKL